MKSTIGYILLATTMIGVVLAALLAQQSNLSSSVSNLQTSYNNQMQAVTLNLDSTSIVKLQENCEVVFSYNDIDGNLTTDASSCLFPQAAFTELDSQLVTAQANPINSSINVAGTDCSTLASGYHSILITNLSLDSFDNDAQSGPQLNGYANLALDSYINTDDGFDYYTINFGSTAFTSLASDGGSLFFGVESPIGQLDGGDFYPNLDYFKITLAEGDLTTDNICISWPNAKTYTNIAQTSTTETTTDPVHFYRVDNYYYHEWDDGETNFAFVLNSSDPGSFSIPDSNTLANSFANGAYWIFTLDSEDNSYCATNFSNTSTYQYVSNISAQSSDAPENLAAQFSYNIFGEEIALYATINQNFSINFDNGHSYSLTNNDGDTLVENVPFNPNGYITCIIPQENNEQLYLNALVTISQEAATQATDTSLIELDLTTITALQDAANLDDACGYHFNALGDPSTAEAGEAGTYDFINLADAYDASLACDSAAGNLSTAYDDQYDGFDAILSDNSNEIAKVNFFDSLVTLYKTASDGNNQYTDISAALTNIQNKLNALNTDFASQVEAMSTLDNNINTIDEINNGSIPLIEGADAEHCEIGFEAEAVEDEFGVFQHTLSLTDVQSSELPNNPICRFFDLALDEIDNTFMVGETETENTIAVAAGTCDGVNAHRIQIVGLPDAGNYNTNNPDPVTIVINGKTFTVQAFYDSELFGDNFLFKIGFPTDMNIDFVGDIVYDDTLFGVTKGPYNSTPKNELIITSNSRMQNICISWDNLTSYVFPE